jgi:hypothetical protein
VRHCPARQSDGGPEHHLQGDARRQDVALARETQQGEQHLVLAAARHSIEDSGGIRATG